MNTKLFYFVPIITLLIGFISFTTISIIQGVFFIDSKYDIPLILNASVMIGDSIILPILNYRVFKLFFKNISSLNIKNLKIFIFITIILSILFNFYTHLSWVNDKYTDFVSLVPGQFSIAGYWHLIYSILQFEIIFIFIYSWINSIKRKDEFDIKYSIKTWYVLLFFSFMNFFDMINKHFFVYQSSFSDTIEKEGFPFITTLITLIVLVTLSIYKKNIFKKVN